MGYNKLTHNELIKLLAQQPGNEKVWNEFVLRFHEYICAVIHRECNRRKHRDRSGRVEDIAQEVYMVIVKNDCTALKKFAGRWDNSIFKYTALIG